MSEIQIGIDAGYTGFDAEYLNQLHAELDSDSLEYGRHSLHSRHSGLVDVRDLIARLHVGRHGVNELISRRLWPVYVGELI